MDARPKLFLGFPMVTPGFERNGKTVSSLIYGIECDPPMIRELIVRLDSDGNSLNGHARPGDPSKRMVNVFPGDTIVFRGEVLKVTSVKVYRSLPPDELAISQYPK